MLSKRFSNTIRCNVDTYWKHSLTEEYNHCLYVEILKYREYRLEHHEDTGDRVYRRIQYAPPPPPGPLRRLAGRFRASLLTEALVFDRSTGCASIDYIPDSLAERTTLRATISCTPVEDGRIERVAECSLSFDLPLIGGLAERTLATFLAEQSAQHARFAEEYVARVTTSP
jgi:hypothetical protein